MHKSLTFQLQAILAVGKSGTSYFCEDENVWKISPIPQGGRQTSAIVIRETLYIVGEEHSFCQYDPCTFEWISLPSMLTNRTNLTTAFHDDFLYVIDVTKCAERYNFTSQRWQYISCLPFQFKTRPSAVAFADKIIVAGVTRQLISEVAEVKIASFNPLTNCWTKSAQ